MTCGILLIKELFMNTYSVNIESGECWYGASAEHGYMFPLDVSSEFSADYTVNRTRGQIAPILISNKGRYIYSETGFSVAVSKGIISISTEDVVELICASESLRGAYLAARENHFVHTGEHPPREFFETPQYVPSGNISESGILSYAEDLVMSGYPTGILVIGEGWQKKKGELVFDTQLFPDPKGMIDTLNSKGFKVLLTVDPYVACDADSFAKYEGMGLFTKTADGKTSYHDSEIPYASLDFSNPITSFVFNGALNDLMREFGVSGFSFDGADAAEYVDDAIAFSELSPNNFTEAWAKFGINHKFNEYRTCVACQEHPLVQRLSDRAHSWGPEGLLGFLPSALAQGIMGYPFSGACAIGGVCPVDGAIDSELFVRYAQCASLLPMMRFSRIPEGLIDDEHALFCMRSARLHTQYGHYILSLAENAAKTGEPIARYMEYEFPGQGFEKVTDQFMLGDKILVAPVLKKGETTRRVTLPQGRWAYLGERIVEGGGIIEVEAPLAVLPFFEKR